MPFDPPYPQNFNAASVRAHAPMESGVYGLSNASRWLYIGEADNIQQALLEHLEEQGQSREPGQPTGFQFERCDRATRQNRRQRLIAEFRPESHAGAPPAEPNSRPKARLSRAGD